MELVAEGVGPVGRTPHAIRSAIQIDYVNWRGERAWRRIVPQRLYFAVVEWHPGEQWILDAWDLDKDGMRSFAMKDIKSWEPVSGPVAS
jgi:predicted DNA-binding transcriptional regulator YafY